MAVGLPLKTTYADGDVYSASDVNDTNGTVNLVGQTNNFYAGKNKIINGDFGVWQRGTSFTNNVSGAFNTDRFKQYYDGTGATRIISQQTFTPAAAPVSGYEGTYYCRFNQTVAGTGGTYNTFTTPIENVRTFAGQTVTLSYWAKAAASLSLTIEADQAFGSGGSSTVTTTIVSGQTITTSWVRYSHSFTMPSVSGKTIGSSSFINLSFKLPLNTTFTFDIWGVQLEAGSTATAFQTASGSIGGELALCQRYYYQIDAAFQYYICNGYATTTTQYEGVLTFPVTMRTSPSAVAASGSAYFAFAGAGGSYTSSTVTLYFPSKSSTLIYAPSASMTAGRGGSIIFNNASATLGFSAEL